MNRNVEKRIKQRELLVSTKSDLTLSELHALRHISMIGNRDDIYNLIANAFYMGVSVGSDIKKQA